MQVEYGPAPLIVLENGRQFGQKTLCKRVHFPKIRLGINKNTLDITGHNVPQNSDRQRQVLVHQRFDRHIAAPHLNSQPDFSEESEIGTQHIAACTLGCRPDDHSSLFLIIVENRFDIGTQTFSLRLVFDSSGYADTRTLRKQHEESGRQGNERRQPGALGAQRIFDYLHDHILKLSYEFTNVWHLMVAITVVECTTPENIGGMEKRRACQSNIDEGCLHSGQDS